MFIPNDKLNKIIKEEVEKVLLEKSPMSRVWDRFRGTTTKDVTPPSPGAYFRRHGKDAPHSSVAKQRMAALEEKIKNLNSYPTLKWYVEMNRAFIGGDHVKALNQLKKMNVARGSERMAWEEFLHELSLSKEFVKIIPQEFSKNIDNAFLHVLTGPATPIAAAGGAAAAGGGGLIYYLISDKEGLWISHTSEEQLRQADQTDQAGEPDELAGWAAPEPAPKPASKPAAAPKPAAASKPASKPPGTEDTGVEVYIGGFGGEEDKEDEDE